MSQTDTNQSTAEFALSNIGGIDHSSTTLRPGVNVLTGKNTTNQTSFCKR